MNKKIAIFTIMMILVFSMAGCSNDTKNAAEDKTNQEQEQLNNQQDLNDKTEDLQNNEQVDENTTEAELLNVLPTITVYSGNADVSGFDSTSVEVESITPENVLAALINEGVLPADVTILSFNESEVDGQQVLDIDFSERFEAFVRTMGTSGEYYTIGSVVNTYLEVFGSLKVRITVNGNVLQTGHSDYPGYMLRFE